MNRVYLATSVEGPGISHAYVVGKTWFAARALAGVVLGAPPERIELSHFDEFEGTAFYQRPTVCRPDRTSDFAVVAVIQRREKPLTIGEVVEASPDTPALLAARRAARAEKEASP